MHTAQLQPLPPAPPGRSGWPWTAPPVAEPQQADTALPRISIVTPSYNQGQFLEEAIRSVLLQGYPNLEYHILDGGSSDESVAIIRRYAPWLAFWVSEPDGGQSAAINKGFALATGEILCWLNSDDILLPGALWAMGAFFAANPEALLVSGQAIWRDSAGRHIADHVITVHALRDLLRYHQGRFLAQPAVFMRRELVQRTGPLDETLTYTMDLDLWLRAGLIIGPEKPLPTLPLLIAALTAHDLQKTTTGGDKVRREVERSVMRYAGLYSIGPAALLLLQAQLLQFRAYALLAEYDPGSWAHTPANLARATRIWARRLPAFLLTPFYGKFAVRCLLCR